eukprot:TRINITY_DN18186_c0_g1_i2.p1 TRINITY_DN18186_c0_g1~~TRINITY_DN18186_c0_g1_i2.p1  ORF type:complete len:479 (+),score=68.09 TRINITY_DN18186_c0_g1_i2:86-1522(+)
MDSYDLNQPTTLPPGELLWPVREDQKPQIAKSVDEFLEVLFFEPHVDRVVVLPNGIELLNQKHGVPELVRDAVRRSRDMQSCLKILQSECRDTFRGRLWQYAAKGKEKEVRLRKKRGLSATEKRTLSRRITQLWAQQKSGEVPQTVPIYISELRWIEKKAHPIVHDEKVQTATNCDIYDTGPLPRQMPLWQRSEGGIFIGDRGTGSGMHTDQCLWSNVGRNWCGFKLFAIWPWEDRHQIIKDCGVGKMFHFPFSEQDVQYMSRAKTIALVAPGDVWVFSGAQPHTALCVGDGLNVTAYESLVPANEDAVTTLVRSNVGRYHPKTFWMDDEDLDETYEDVVDNIQRALKDPNTSTRVRLKLNSCVDAMRTFGDEYCRKLWRKEKEKESNKERSFGGTGSKDSGSNGGVTESTRSPSHYRSCSASLTRSRSRSNSTSYSGSLSRNNLSQSRSRSRSRKRSLWRPSPEIERGRGPIEDNTN